MTILLALTAVPPVLVDKADRVVPPAAWECSITGITAAKRKADLPPEVLHYVDDMADRGKRFRVSDAAAPGDEDLPVKRLVCGYPTLDGYVVEQEVGGSAPHLAKERFRRGRYGYSPS